MHQVFLSLTNTKNIIKRTKVAQRA